MSLPEANIIADAAALQKADSFTGRGWLKVVAPAGTPLEAYCAKAGIARKQICAIGVTFRYTESGEPRGLCKAKKLYYVTTAGGPIYSDAFGYGYVKALAETFYGIPETEMISAENLDVIGADVEAILRDTMDKQIRRE